ncbi:arylamine N-acetyltransferase [Enterobacter asburiae]|uniref:arylamine N-acetyltransferase family protein n=1 Tax=Enterobacter asburiae TaxID=61645 RepID=UPI00192BD38A|nr:arylamine N-acetyltransferase [Enterobacter asburiae]MBL5841298.1 arylamine N-acetyltransferase [Enterobacter asburiae]MBL5914253.1 arylamine N-acetyltransferase [Enterobacter asburiae]MBL5918545.1 arylamine N-acetyltransferase [Enterobacter asburiae]MBL5941692.1 arylamine N-acetyltransferase [Enterobacter asburiae]MBL5963626.1 arylamine N-acetyltransferase [Enterobacter asburiae]
MKDIKKYLERLSIADVPTANYTFLSKLHHAHFYKIPFENLSMKDDSNIILNRDEVFAKIVLERRGGICFEVSVLLQELFDHIGLSYDVRLARVLTPHTTSVTHQLLIVKIDSKRWVFDVGFGAKGPRALLLLADGYVHNDPFLSTRITKDAAQGWIVSVKENSKQDAHWENIYSFHDIMTLPVDINMAYFFTRYSPESLLNTNRVLSLPKENGRVSIRNNVFTEVNGFESTSVEIPDDETVFRIMKEVFGITITSEKY